MMFLHLTLSVSLLWFKSIIMETKFSEPFRENHWLEAAVRATLMRVMTAKTPLFTWSRC